MRYKQIERQYYHYTETSQLILNQITLSTDNKFTRKWIKLLVILTFRIRIWFDLYRTSILVIDLLKPTTSYINVKSQNFTFAEGDKNLPFKTN